MSAGGKGEAQEPPRGRASDAQCLVVAEVFAAMGDRNRVKILLQLLQGEQCVSDLASALGVSESAVSQHLRLLRTLRLVRFRKQGRYVHYALDDHHVKDLLAICLEHAQGG